MGAKSGVYDFPVVVAGSRQGRDDAAARQPGLLRRLQAGLLPGVPPDLRLPSQPYGVSVRVATVPGVPHGRSAGDAARAERVPHQGAARGAPSSPADVHIDHHVQSPIQTPRERSTVFARRRRRARRIPECHARPRTPNGVSIGSVVFAGSSRRFVSFNDIRQKATPRERDAHPRGGRVGLHRLPVARPRTAHRRSRRSVLCGCD